jgi:hypothetical protein
VPKDPIAPVVLCYGRVSDRLRLLTACDTELPSGGRAFPFFSRNVIVEKFEDGRRRCDVEVSRRVKTGSNVS